MIGIIFATKKEAEPFLKLNFSSDINIKISGVGLEAARIASEELIKEKASYIINAGVCAGLHHRVKRGEIYRISTVITEGLKTAVNIGIGFNLKKLVSVEEPLYQVERKRELARQYDLVDMEGYAVARVCEKYSIPCLLIKGVTDFGDQNAKDDIQNFLPEVSKSIAEAISYVLEGLKKKKTENKSLEPIPKSFLKRLMNFVKIEHTIFSLPLIFAGGWLGSNNPPSLKVLLLLVVVALGARIFGMSLNRIFDRKIDRDNPRTSNRELVTGALNIRHAYSVATIGLAFYLLGCWLLGSFVFKICYYPIIPLIIYSFLKRFTFLCHFGIGVVLASAPLCAYIAVSESLVLSENIILLTLFTFLWISGFDIIYSLMDKEFDRSNNVYSLPASIGDKGAQLIAAIIHIIAFSMLVLLWINLGGILALIAMIVSAFAFSAAYKQSIPISFRFFPISIIAGISASLVVLLGGI